MNKQFGRKFLAVLAAAAVPFTTLISSAPLTVNAADNVTFDTKTSSVVSSGTKGSTTINGRNIARGTNGYLDYKYTGNIFTAKSSLYDYLSDNEVNGIERYSTAEGYADPYIQLNRAISEYNISVASPSSENLTIRYKPDKEKEGCYVNRYYVSVYLYQDGTGNNNGWPGKTMTYDAANEEFVYTVKYSDIGFSPNRFIIQYTSKDNNNKDKTEETGTISAALSKGKAYRYRDNGNISEIGNADTIYNKGSNYDVPLYFGCFYLDDDPTNEKAGNDASHYIASKKSDGTYKGRAHTNYYQNFYWQANLSLRKDDRVSEEDEEKKINFDASVQGLVDNTLTNGTITQNGKTLPYFSDEWADSHSGLVNYWHNIAFPFYEIDVDASKVYGDVPDSDSERDKYVAKYYQFNSKEGDKYSLYFQPDNANKTGTYQETKTAIVSQPTTTAPGGTISYLPFNSKNEYEKNALGFGMNFEMDFRIRADGKVDTYDSNGKPTGKSVNATFEFMGDDDVWVFIDDQLVLDLGGAHKDTTGIIDFAERKVYANDAITLGDGTGKDDLSGNLSSQKVVNLKDVMVSDTFTADNHYNETKVHTLRMFYMERGMYESDLLVRFNFSAIPNNNTLKIREITNFKDINEGLINLTKQAADYDVFNYTVSNTGTAKEDVGESGISTPTYNYYQRQNEANTALTANLTGKPVVYDTVTFSGILLDTSKTLNGGKTWDDDCRLGAWIWKEGGEEGQLYFGEETSSHLYKFSGFPSDSNKVVFFRLDKNVNYSTSTWPSFYNRTNEITFEKGYTYKINDWDNSVSRGSKVADEQVIHYDETKNFNPDNGSAVKATNYIWKDVFAVKTSGSEPEGMTGITDDSGSFNLMYGTAENESSAEFLKQFKKGSTMYVNQLDDLKKVTRSTENLETFEKPNGRSASEYYSTTVTVVDSNVNTILSKNSSQDPTHTEYFYKNADGVDENAPVQLTETFINTPKVYSLKITKELAPDDDVSDSFSFRLALTNIFGIEGINADSTAYANLDIIIKDADSTDLPESRKLGKDAVFTLQRNQTAIINGIPYGTSYTVTEIVEDDSNYKPKPDDNDPDADTSTVSGTVGQDDSGAPTNTDSQETITNTRKTGELKLEKQLSGNTADSGITNATRFTFKVVISNPDVDLDDYEDGFQYLTDSMSVPMSVTKGTITEGTIVFYNTDSDTFTVYVSVDDPVTISGLPYGTTYSVSEEDIPLNWSSDVQLTGATVIGNGSSSVTVKNTYTPPPEPEFGNLEVSKTVIDSDGSDITFTEPFYFTVNLTNAAGEPVSGVFNTVYYLNGVQQSSATLTFNSKGEAGFTLTDNESIVIVDIPVDSLYTVTENVNAEFDQSFDSNTGSIQNGITSQVNFTNKKKFIPYELPESGFEDTRMYFVFALSGMMMCGLTYFLVNRRKIKKH